MSDGRGCRTDHNQLRLRVNIATRIVNGSVPAPRSPVAASHMNLPTLAFAGFFDSGSRGSC